MLRPAFLFVVLAAGLASRATAADGTSGFQWVDRPEQGTADLLDNGQPALLDCPITRSPGDHGRSGVLAPDRQRQLGNHGIAARVGASGPNDKRHVERPERTVGKVQAQVRPSFG